MIPLRKPSFNRVQLVGEIHGIWIRITLILNNFCTLFFGKKRLKTKKVKGAQIICI